MLRSEARTLSTTHDPAEATTPTTGSNTATPTDPASTDPQPNQTVAAATPPPTVDATTSPRRSSTEHPHPTHTRVSVTKNRANARGSNVLYGSLLAQEGIQPSLKGVWPYLEPSSRRRKRQPRTRGPAAMRPMRLNPEPQTHPVPVRWRWYGRAAAPHVAWSRRVRRGVYTRGRPPSVPPATHDRGMSSHAEVGPSPACSPSPP